MSRPKAMLVAYLMNSYPMTSTTFIRREIEALEQLGVAIDRYAVREWPGTLVDERDVQEKKRTTYLLTGNIVGLLLALPLAIVTNPLGVLKALPIWFKLMRNAKGGLIKHIAYLMQAAYFYRLVTARGIDHIHAHFASNAAAVAMLTHMMGGPPYSFTVHGPDELLIPDELSFALKIEHAAFVIAISEFCRNFLIDHARPAREDKIIIARCGLALEEFPAGETEERDNDALVCVGRLCPQKGQILIPKAVAALRAEFPRLKVILIGDGDIRGEIEQQISIYDVADSVQLRGWVDNRSVLQLVRSSRALLLPSYAEGLPVVIMEALALGTPVISTTIAGIPELVDDLCGWLFPPGDEAKLVEAMRAALLCTPDQLRCLSRAGRARVARLHDRMVLAETLKQNMVRSAANFA